MPDYSAAPTLSIIADSSSVSKFELKLGTHSTNITGIYSNGLFQYHSSTLDVVMLKSHSSVNKTLNINPVVINFIGRSSQATNNVSLNVKSPISLSLYDNVLTIGLTQATIDSVQIHNYPGICRINGLRPDDSGNLTIQSVSPELTITTTTSSESSDSSGS